MKVPYEEETWKRYREEIEKRMAYYREVISLIPSDVKSILDVGCGEGTFLNMLTSLGRASMIVGLDVSETALKYIEGQKIRASAGGLPFRNGSFDLVTCLETLEHLKQEVFIRAIEEIKRVTKKYIIVSVPNEEPLEYFLVVCPACGCHFNAVGHVRSFSPEILRELFSPDFSLKALRECGDLVEHPTYNKVLFGALRSYLKPQPPGGSICPQCGYVAKADKGRISYSQMPIFLKAVKRIADLLWPPKKRRQWLVALYERVIEGQTGNR
jgi:SAM-dependent methyltransferase